MSAQITYHDVFNNTNAKWWRDPGMRRGMVHIGILYTCVYSLGYDGSLLNGLQALPAWQTHFGHPTGTKLGLIAASYYLPKIPSTFVIAWMMDRLGRKIPLIMGAIFMLAGSLFAGFSQNLGQFVGARVFLGIGTAAAQIAAASMIPELAHPRIRHIAGALLNTTYFIGSIFSSWLTFAMVFYPGNSSWSWRIPTLVQGLGPVLLGIGVWFVPQSPRWLVQKGRLDEAQRILATYHANGDLHDPLVELEMQEIQAQVDAASVVTSAGWLDFFKTRGNIRRFFVIILIGTSTQWVGNGLVNYFLSPILKQVGITKPAQTNGINGGISIWSWLVAMTGASLANRFGRRNLFLTSLAGCLVSFVFITALSGSYAETKRASVGIALVPWIYLFNAAYAIALTPIPMLYVPEISPYGLRAKSAALLLLSQNVSQTFNQFVNPVALAAIAWKYFIVYLAVIAAYLVLFFFFVRETRGLTVEEASEVYDDDSLRVALGKSRESAEDAGGKKDLGDLERAGSVDKKEETTFDARP